MFIDGLFFPFASSNLHIFIKAKYTTYPLWMMHQNIALFVCNQNSLSIWLYFCYNYYKINIIWSVGKIFCCFVYTKASACNVKFSVGYDVRCDVLSGISKYIMKLSHETIYEATEGDLFGGDFVLARIFGDINLC